MSADEFDVVVLGGGSGGYAAAIRAAELGKRVALVEEDKLGGTCLHRGCIPTKALLHAAEVADTIRGSGAIGITATLEGIDMLAVARWRDGVVGGKYKGLQSLISHRGITVVTGTGNLASDATVHVGDRVLRGTDVILATGSFSRTLPGVDVAGRVLTSEGALALESVPQSVIVLGGGVIGVEFASLWRSLGAEVTIVEALDHLIANEDASSRKTLERAFRRRGITSHLSARVESVTQTTDAAHVTLEDGTTLSADYVLVSVGRGPRTSGIGLEGAGVTLDRGFVVTDEHLQTTVPHVWAVGDIVPGLQLAHRGFQQGIFVAERIAGLNPTPIPDQHLPRVTYSHPEVASVGLTEQQAIDVHGVEGIASYEYNLAGNGKSHILGTSGIVKVVRAKNGPVLGVHMVGDRVGELISEAQLVVGWEAHPDDVTPYVHAHPTQSEALGEAFLALAGKPLHAI